MKIPKNKEEWIGAVIHQWWIKVAIVALTATSGWLYAQTKGSAANFVRDTVKPQIDSLAKQVDTVNIKMEKVEESLDAVDRKMDALISVMSDAFPAFKQKAKERARRETDDWELKKSLEGEVR